MPLVQRFFHMCNGSFFLFGPRGTGKSTWLHQSVDSALWVDLVQRDTYRMYSARPERLRDVVSANPKQRRVVINDVQRVPEVLDVVQELMRTSADRAFILTGSSTRTLRRPGVNLLGGRAVNLSMHPFMAAELGSRFDLDQALQVGLLPAVVASDSPKQMLSSYVGLYLEQEVQAEVLVRNVGAFSRFLEAMAFWHGAQLNVSAVSRECQVSRNIVERYVSVLDDLLLGFCVPVFSRNARRHLKKHPKFYYFDAGVFRSLRPLGPLDSPHVVADVALEGLVAQHLRAWIGYDNEDCKLYHWRTKSGVGTDFVVYGPSTFLALNVKNSSRVYRRDVRSLLAFCEDCEQARPCLLYRGSERVMVDGVLCIPCEQFLLRLRPDLPLNQALDE